MQAYYTITDNGDVEVVNGDKSWNHECFGV